MPHKAWFIVSAVAGFTAVLFGAFGAHAVADSLSEQMLSTYRTGSLYHLTHAPVLLGVALWMQQAGASRWLRISAWLFSIGIVLFSGSLYLLAITGSTELGMITPVGGLAFLVAWFGLFMQVASSR
jgi:uncharacterized membrane protein YgdD (TMEM256/DUF423 family)